MSAVQLDMFGGTTPSTSPLGVLVVLPCACQCGSAVGTVGSSAGCHHARIVCGQCGKFLRWMPAADFSFIAEIIDVTGGRPREPIIIRNHSEQGF